MSGNSIYISVGLTIIAALVAALVGPFFVDWDAYRPALQEAGARLIGAPVTINGRVRARLLPIPSLTAEEIVVGDSTNPLLRVARFAAQLDVAPLLKGEVKVAELALDRPYLFLVVDETGRLDLPARPADAAPPAATSAAPATPAAPAAPADFAVERAVVTGGVVDYVDMRSGARLRLEDLAATASLVSVGGPMKLEGDGRIGSRAVSLRLSTGRRGDDGVWPVKLQGQSPADQIQLNLDLALDLATGSPHATGALVAQRLADGGRSDGGKGDRGDLPAPPWRVAARLDGRADLVQLADVELTIGPDDRAVALTGRGEVRLAAHPRYDLTLAARQLDLDRLTPGRPGAPPDLAEAMRRALGLVAGINRFDVDGRLAVDVASVVLAGGLGQDLKAVVKPRVDQVAVDSFEIRLPGRSRVSASGRLATGGPEAGTFTGTGSLASEQPQVLAAWLRKDRAGGILPAFALAGRVTLSPTLTRIDDATLSLGGAAATGSLAIESPRDGAPRRLAARLAAETLDLDRIVALGSLFGVDGDGLAGNADLDLSVGTLTVGDLVARTVVARLARDGDRLTVDRLAVADAEGTSITASGTVDHIFTRPEGALQATVRAERPDGVERLAARLVPGLDDRWRRFAGRLAPLTASLDLDANAGAGNAKLTVAAKAADTDVAAEIVAAGSLADWRAATLAAKATVTAPDAAALARQLGAEPARAAGPRRVALEASATGTAAALDVAATADVAGARLAVKGAARPLDAGLAGALTLSAPDLAALAELAGLARPWPHAAAPPAAVAATLAGRLTLGPDGAGLADLAGQIGPSKVSGALAVAPSGPLTGRLAFDDLDAVPLVEALLGRGALSAPKGRPDDVWSPAPLAGPVGAGLAADVAVTAGRLVYGPGRALDKASFRFGLADGEARLDDIAAGLAGGRLAGNLGVKRTRSGDLAVAATLGLTGVRLAETPWRRDGRDVAGGVLDADLLITSEGGSVAALVAGASGNGSFTLADAELKALDPTVFAALAEAIAAGTDLRDDRLRAAVPPRLDAGALSRATVKGAVWLAAGTLRVRNAVAEAGDVRATGTVTADLTRWTLDGQIALAGPPALAAANGTPARLAVQFRGPIDRPERRLDLSQLQTWAVTKTLDRETARAEQARLEAETRRKREDEARQKREEDARLKREEEARLKREEDARRAAPAVPPQSQPPAAQPAAPAVPAHVTPPAPRPVAPPQPQPPAAQPAAPAVPPQAPAPRPAVPAVPAQSQPPAAQPAAPVAPAQMPPPAPLPAVPAPAEPAQVPPPAPRPATVPAQPAVPAQPGIPTQPAAPAPIHSAPIPPAPIPPAPIPLPPMAPILAVPDAPVIRSVTPEPPPGQPLILGPIGR